MKQSHTGGFPWAPPVPQSNEDGSFFIRFGILVVLLERKDRGGNGRNDY